MRSLPTRDMISIVATGLPVAPRRYDRPARKGELYETPQNFKLEDMFEFVHIFTIALFSSEMFTARSGISTRMCTAKTSVFGSMRFCTVPPVNTFPRNSPTIR